MYSASLTNGEGCVFDSFSGFDTIREAIEWSMGRGNHYRIDIDGDDISSDFPRPQLHCDRNSLFCMVDESGSPYTWMPCKRRFLTIDEAIQFVK